MKRMFLFIVFACFATAGVAQTLAEIQQVYPEMQSKLIIEDSAAVYAHASSDSAIVRHLKMRDQVWVYLEIDDFWAAATASEGFIGYVQKKNLGQERDIIELAARTAALEFLEPLTPDVPKFRYIMVTLSSANMLNSRVSVAIDYGARSKNFLGTSSQTAAVGGSELRNKGGGLVKFESAADAFNYLGSRGWELIEKVEANDFGREALRKIIGGDDLFKQKSFTYIFRQKVQ